MSTKWNNQHHTSRNSYPSARNPLSNTQKAKLAILARKAARAMHLTFVNDTQYQMWRHEQQTKACGKHSLTLCSQDDFNPLVAHFLDLAGESGEAMNRLLKHGVEEKEVAFHKLTEACDQAGLPMAYAATVSRNKFKVGLNDCTAKQLWQLVFTIKRRSGAKKKTKEAGSTDPF